MNSIVRRLPWWLSFCAMVFVSGVVGLSACGTGPYEECLGDADCPATRVCSTGRCQAKQTPETFEEKKASEKSKEVAGKEIPKADGGVEPVAEPPGDGGPTESMPKESTPPEVQCRQDADCGRGERCAQGKCEVDPTGQTCTPVKSMGEFSHPYSANWSLMVFRPDGKAFAVFGHGRVEVRDLLTGKLLFVFQHDGAATNLFWSPDGQSLGAISSKEIKVWSLQKGALLRTFTGALAAFSSDNKNLWILEKDGFAAWDLQSGQRGTKVSLVGYDASKMSGINGLVSPSGRYFVAFEGFSDALVWEIESGKKIASFALGQTSYFGVLGFVHEDVFALHIARSVDDRMTFFSVKEAKKIGELELTSQALALRSDGKSLYALVGSEVKLYDLSTPQTQPTKVFTISGNQPSLLALQPDEQALWLGSSNGLLRQHKLSDGLTMQFILPSGAPRTEVFFDATGGTDLLGVYSADGLVKLWDLAESLRFGSSKLKALRFFPALEPYKEYKTGLVVGPMRKTAISYDGGSVRLWDFETGTLKKVLENEALPPDVANNRTRYVYYLPQADKVVSLQSGDVFKAWELSDGKLLHQSSLKNGNYLATVLGVSPSTGVVATMVLTSDYTQTITLWDPANLHKKAYLPYEGFIYGIGMAPTKPWMAVMTRKKTVEIVDLQTSKVIQTLPLEFGTGVVGFGPQSRILVVRVGTKAHLFDTTTWAKIRSFDSTQNNFVVSPNGKHFAIGDLGGKVLVWDIQSGQLLATLLTQDPTYKTVDYVRYSPDGRYLIFGSHSSGRLQAWTCP